MHTSAFVQPLSIHQLGKIAVFADKLLVTALLGDTAVVHHNNTVAVAYGGKPVGDHDTGAVQPIQRLGYLTLRLVVQGAGGFVKNKDLWLGCIPIGISLIS